MRRGAISHLQRALVFPAGVLKTQTARQQKMSQVCSNERFFAKTRFTHANRHRLAQHHWKGSTRVTLGVQYWWKRTTSSRTHRRLASTWPTSCAPRSRTEGPFLELSSGPESRAWMAQPSTRHAFLGAPSALFAAPATLERTRQSGAA